MTFDDVIEEILGQLQAWTASPDQVTSLAADITSSDLTLSVTDSSFVSRGMIEIGDELLYVQNVNTASNSLTILTGGRGWRRTTAAAHSTGATVTVSPTVPRWAIKTEMNNQIRALYPNIFGVSKTSFTLTDITVIGWVLPAEALAVLDVRYKDAFANWQRVRHWEVEFSANTTDFATGTSLRILGVPSNSTVEVVYATRPAAFTDSSTAFSTTGLPDSAKDLVVLGTLIRILPALDMSRLGVQQAEAAAVAANRQLDAATAISKGLQMRYAQRLAEERTALNKQYPARIHIGR